MFRIPRFENARPDRDLAILEYVRQYYPSVPVARVVKSDLTCNNILGKPYLLQKKLSGFQVHPGAAEYLTLTHQQKLAFASHFGTVLRTLFERKSKEPGLIELASPSSTRKPSHGESPCSFCTRPFDVGRPPLMGTEEYPGTKSSSGLQPDYTSTLAFLQSRFGPW